MGDIKARDHDFQPFGQENLITLQSWSRRQRETDERGWSEKWQQGDNKQNLWQGRSRRSCQQSHRRRNSVQRDRERLWVRVSRGLTWKSNNASLKFRVFSVGDPRCVTDLCSGLSHAKDQTPYLQPADKRVQQTDVRIIRASVYLLIITVNFTGRLQTWEIMWPNMAYVIISSQST